MSLLHNVFFLILCFIHVNSMALHGQPLTRYVPCGLGVIYFDKVVDKLWHGNVQLGLYHFLDVTIDLQFEYPVDFYNYQGIQSRNRTQYKILFQKNMAQYNFLIFQSDNNPIPAVKMFALNDYVLCGDGNKIPPTIQSAGFSCTEHNIKVPNCGRKKDKAIVEVLNVNTLAILGEWPWHVAILLKQSSTEKTTTTAYQCGGTIISEYAVITAGHCVCEDGLAFEPNKVLVVAGVINYQNPENENLFWATKINVHPSYDSRRATADLAVVNVDKFSYNNIIQPICIWGEKYDKSELYGREAVIVGFGRTEFRETLPKQLRSARTMVQNDTTCINFDPVLYSFLLDEFTFCAGYESYVGINPKSGDSGGGLIFPLVQEDGKISWTLRGVMSKCGVKKGEIFCSAELYSVYTDVAPHSSWTYHHSGKVV